MSNKTIISIDPGSSNGGIAVWNPGQPAKVMRMPSNENINDLNKYFGHVKEVGGDVTVFIEKVSLWGSDNSEDNPGKQYRIKVMLANYERIIALIVFHGFKYVEVYPQSWQSKLGLRKKYEDDTEKKNAFKLYAQNCFPEVKVTLWCSDALCILQYALIHTNNQTWLQGHTKNQQTTLF